MRAAHHNESHLTSRTGNDHAESVACYGHAMASTSASLYEGGRERVGAPWGRDYSKGKTMVKHYRGFIISKDGIAGDWRVTWAEDGYSVIYARDEAHARVIIDRLIQENPRHYEG